MSMTPQEFLNAKICFSAAALLLLVGSGKWIIYGQLPIKWQLILVVFVFGSVGASWVWVLHSVDSRQASLTKQRPEVDVKLFFSQMPRQYPLREYTLMIQNLNPVSALITDCRIEFNFINIIADVKSRLFLPTGGAMSVEGLEIYEQNQNITKPLYIEKPPETSMAKEFTFDIRQAEINGKSVNTNFLLFTCSRWPEKASFTANIIVDLSKKAKDQNVQTKPAMAGTYEGEYFYEIAGQRFSQTIHGSIPSD